MNGSFEKLTTTARILANDRKFENAIDAYIAAADMAPGIEYQIDIYNELAYLYQEQKNTGEAILYYKKSIGLYDELEDSNSEQLLANKAGILNNLGALHMLDDSMAAVKYHKEALLIIEKLFQINEAQFIHYLINTHYSIASNFQQAGDAYQAVKAFRQILEISDKLKGSTLEKARPILASTYFQLGMIKSDQDKEQEARTFYHKSIHHYEKLVETYPNQFLPYLASVMNNLAVLNRQNGYHTETKKYYLKTIDAYESLVKIDEETFLSYYAASLNALANVHADSWTPEDDLYSGDRGFLPGFGLFGSSTEEEVNEKDEKEKSDLHLAEKYYGQALNAYQRLADLEPDSYTHYVAMILHNLGVLYDEKKDFKAAENYYKQALGIRKNLAQKEPYSFDTDVCITQMNLVTLYQTLMERTIDFSYKDLCLELLADTRSRLAKYTVNELPESIQNLLGDMEYFTTYFSEITEADLVANVLADKSRRLNDEALSTLDFTKRLEFYDQILSLYYEAISKYSSHEKLLNDLEFYLPQVISAAILNKQSNKAEEIVDRFILLLPLNYVVQSQNAIIFLNRGNRKAGEDILLKIKEENNFAGDNIGILTTEQAEKLGLKF